MNMMNFKRTRTGNDAGAIPAENGGGRSLSESERNESDGPNIWRNDHFEVPERHLDNDNPRRSNMNGFFHQPLPKIPKPTTRLPKLPPTNWPLPIPPNRIPKLPIPKGPIPFPKGPIPLPNGGHWAAWTVAAIAVAGAGAAAWAVHRWKQRKWAGKTKKGRLA